MPAKLLRRVSEEGTFSHVYNNGVENLPIFKDQQDYKVFLGFLKDYLSPVGPEIPKKVFTIKGNTFHGTPRQPKNYLNKVDLIAYRLTPTHFHLILHQTVPNSLGNFIRSLCTRYSIYFNKKYHHSGPLFNGPYKSIHVKDADQLLDFTRYLHRSPDNGENPIEIYTSYPEYLGQRDSPWVNTKAVLSVKGIDDYCDFVEKYQPDQSERDLLEAKTEVPTINIESPSPEIPTEPPIIVRPDTNSKPRSRASEYGFLAVVFVILLVLGVSRVNASQSKYKKDPLVLSESTSMNTSPIPTLTTAGSSEPIVVVTIKTTDASISANIRKEPSYDSEIIGLASNGDVFESVSIGPEWSGIKLDDGTIGFITSKLIQIDLTNN